MYVLHHVISISKNQIEFQRNQSATSQILAIRLILEGVRAKKRWRNNIIRRLLHGLWLHTQRVDGSNTPRLRPTQRNPRGHNDAI